MRNKQWGSTQRSSYPINKMVPKGELKNLTSKQKHVYKKMHKKKVRKCIMENF